MNRSGKFLGLCLLLTLMVSTAIEAQDSLNFASGSWYDPQRNGEGFVVQIIPGGSALVTWFTYPPEGEDSQQAWLIGQGTVSGNKITIDQMQRPVGAKFGAGFDPNDVVREDWGSLTLIFNDCNTAMANWSGPPAFGDGTMSLARLSFLEENE